MNEELAMEIIAEYKRKHLSDGYIQDLMEEFFKEYTYGDSFDLAKFMYNKGIEDAIRNEY